MTQSRAHSIRLDSDHFGARQCLATWREEIARSVLGLDFKPGGDRPFHARMDITLLGDLTFSRTTTTPVLSFRDKSLLDPNSDTFTFAWRERGELIAAQRGHEHSLSVAQGVLLSSDEAGQLCAPAGGHYGTIILPRASLDARVANVDDFVMRPTAPDAQLTRLLADYCRLVQRDAARARAPARATMARHLADLVALALRGDSEKPSRREAEAAADARLVTVMEKMAALANDPGLSLPALARACGCSPRNIQMVLERAGLSFTGCLLDLRLARAFRMLSNSHAHPPRVSDVALAVGFSDISYFNRRFRARFGDTPTGVRAIPTGAAAMSPARHVKQSPPTGNRAR